MSRLLKPIDISYTYEGQCPISVRLVEYLMSNRGIRNIAPIIKALNIEVTAPSRYEDDFFTTKKGPMGIHRRKVLVYFIGGVTYAEISAVRFLNKLYSDKEFIIATTCIISGRKVLKQMTPDIENNVVKSFIFLLPSIN